MNVEIRIQIILSDFGRESAEAQSDNILEPGTLCFECGEPAVILHHVIPRARGGKRSVPLCAKCEAKVHERKAPVDIGTLTKERLAHKRAKGEKLGGDVPFGFRAVETDRGGRTVKGLEPEPCEQAALALARRLRAEGLTLRATADEMARQGCFGRSGAKWNIGRLCRVLKRQAEADR